MEIDRTERRILASLAEKRFSVPEQYPLSLNALVAACNQRSNRDPAMDLKDFEVTGALLALREKGLVLIRERDGGRVQRYAERLAEHLGTDDRATAVLAELMLRGPQTAPELLRRLPRMVPTEHENQVDEALAALSALHLVRLLPRASGQRHARWTHLLAPESEAPPAPEEPPAPASAAPRRDEITALREEVAALRDEVAALREELRAAGRVGKP